MWSGGRGNLKDFVEVSPPEKLGEDVSCIHFDLSIFCSGVWGKKKNANE